MRPSSLQSSARGILCLWWCFAWLTAFTSQQVVAAAEVDLSTKLRGQYFSGLAGVKDSHQWDVTNRLTAKMPLRSNLSLEASYQLVGGLRDLSPEYLVLLGGGGQLLLPEHYASRLSLFRVADFKFDPLSASTGEFVQQNLDRLLVSYYGEKLTLDLGRQQIAFGSGQMVNPSDFLAPKRFAAFADEVRSGVDGLRLRYALGDMSQVDVGVVAASSKEQEDMASFITAVLFTGNVELRPMLAHYYKATMLGLDIAGSIGGTGVWLEGAWTRPKPAAAKKSSSPYSRAVLGAMRQLSPLSSVAFEYYYNGAGEASAPSYSANVHKFAYRLGGVRLQAQNYLGLTGNVRIAPLLTSRPQVVANLDDSSLFLSLSLTWEVKEGLYLTGNVRGGMGKGQLGPVGQQRPGSEFGTGYQAVMAALQAYY